MKLIYLTLACVLMAACGGDDMADLREFVKNSGADMRGKIEPPPNVKMYEPFAYNNDANLPDPFKPRKPVLNPSGKRGENEPDMNRPKEALEDFPLESLKMVGYVLKDKVPHAVVRAPDKKVYNVKVGNYIGMNFGLITKITDTEIDIKEEIQDSNGDWSKRDSTLQLLDEGAKK
jgi:type IV pilus assembly protein PilP